MEVLEKNMGSQKQSNFIPLFKVFMSKEAKEAAVAVLSSGYVGQGYVVDEFEDMLEQYLDCTNLVTLNSGTSAIHLALRLLNLNEGDEVLASPLTCSASNLPILANNLKVKWVDINTDDLNMDLQDLTNKVTRETKAVIIPYWGGYPSDIIKLRKLKKDLNSIDYKFDIIEDAAHAFGATYKDRMIGSFNEFYTAFSFQAIKHLTCVDGGALVLSNDSQYRRAKLLRWYGLDRENNKDFRYNENIHEWGYKFHMNDLNASIGLGNLNSVDFRLQAHKVNTDFYNKHLRNVNGLRLLKYNHNRKSSNWLYTILVEHRENFIRKMTEDGIQVSPVHQRNDSYACFNQYRYEQLPNLSSVANQIVCLPIGWWLNITDRQYIVDRIKEGW